jgi:glyoxylase I family protein
MPSIEHFAVYADDSARLAGFYVQVMGLRVIVESGGEPPGFFLADDHGMAIEVLGRPPGTPGVNQRWVCHLAFWVDDYAAKRTELERHGVIFET